jgi:peptidoglycan/LPS O-acetylase OafA/YrhL
MPSLQGLRAVAVLAVFGFHVGALSGGWLGVELFFVLSGFLISLVILASSDSGTFSLAGFYWRRFARLMPAAVMLIFVICLVSWAFEVEFRAMLLAGFASLLYSANFAEIGGLNMGGFGHMWSLSVEEHFYVLWPLGLLFLSRRQRSSTLIGLSAVIVALLGLRVGYVLLSEDWFARVYYGTDTRSPALLLGSLAAISLARGGARRIVAVPVWVTVAVMLFVLVALVLMPMQSTTAWLLGVLAFDVSVAALLLGLTQSHSWLERALSWRPLVYVGDISYSLYLWHLPVIYLASRIVDGPARYLIQLVVPFVLAALSYHLVESPIRRWAGEWSPRPAQVGPAC